MAAEWLNDEEQRTWRAFIWASQRVAEDLDRQLQRDSDMPHAYYMILVMLCESPRRTRTMTELAQLLRFSASRLSHAVSRLESRGWVTRGKDPHCGRTTVARLTDCGYRALEDAAPGHLRQVRLSVFDHLDHDDQRRLREVCEKLLSDSETDTCRPADAPTTT